jgi:hypothetical protein
VGSGVCHDRTSAENLRVGERSLMGDVGVNAWFGICISGQRICDFAKRVLLDEPKCLQSGQNAVSNRSDSAKALFWADQKCHNFHLQVEFGGGEEGRGDTRRI